MSRAMSHLLSAVDKSQQASSRTQRMVRVALARWLTLEAMRRAA